MACKNFYGPRPCLKLRCRLHAVWSIRVWSTRVKISPVLKILGKIRVFSRSKYWTLLAQGSAWQTTTHHFWHIVSAFKFRLQKCNSMIKIWPVFKKREEICQVHCTIWNLLFSYGIVLFHCSIFTFSSIQFDQRWGNETRKWNKEKKQGNSTVLDVMTLYHKGRAKGHQYWKFLKF